MAGLVEEFAALRVVPIDDTLIARWRQIFEGVTPLDFFAFATRDGLSITSLSFVCGNPPLRFYLQASFEGKPAYRMNRKFFYRGAPIQRKTVELSLLEIKEEFQGCGWLKHILSHSVRCYREAGVQRFELEANISVGGYAFARYGFYVDEDSLPSLEEQVRDNLSKVPQEELADATQIVDGIKWNNPDVANLISELKFGRELLLGTCWTGYLDLTDSGHMDVFWDALA